MLTSSEPASRLEGERTREKLGRYLELLVKWNSAINLVGRGSVPEAATRHFSDCLQLLPVVPARAKRWLDLGSGGGFPGMVIAIQAAETHPDLRVTMIEADQRKAEFLRTVSRETGVETSVLSCRIEDAPVQNADVISARALAPVSVLCGYAALHGGETSIGLFMKGKSYRDELAEARRHWGFDVEEFPSITSPESAILRMRNIRRV